MNSSLPNFLPSAGAGSCSAPQLNAGALTGLPPNSISGLNGEGLPATSNDFSSLMPVAPAVPAVALVTTVTPPAEMPPTIAVALSGRRFSPVRVSNLSPSNASVDQDPMPGASAVPLSLWSRGAPAPVVADSATGEARLADETAAAAEVPTEIREQAVAFAVTLLQSLLPAAQAPVLPSADSAPRPASATASSPGEVLPWANSAETTISIRPGQTPAAASLRSPILSPNSEIVSAPAPVASRAIAPATAEISGAMASPVPPLPTRPIANPENLPVGDQSPTLAGSVSTPAGTGPNVFAGEPAFITAEDGALECKITLPPPVAAQLESDREDFSGSGVEFQAELEISGQPLVRVESTGFSLPSAAGERAVVAVAIPRENFAAKNRSPGSLRNSGGEAGERKFEITGDKQVTSRSPEAGITVAKTDPIMPAAPTEEPRAARSAFEPMGLPVRAEFQVAQTPAERITAPASVPSGQNFAERAVDTVTGLVDAQFSASMHRAGSVQLNLKFGGEDLSVRVEIRDGAVHADFRTDSAPLRAALERQWQAVAAASPEQMQRYVEPVFSTGSSQPSPASSQGDARQQQHQTQSDGQHHASRESFSDHPVFNRRSLVGESFVPTPPAPRVAAFLPTSVRLSALA